MSIILTSTAFSTPLPWAAEMLVLILLVVLRYGPRFVTSLRRQRDSDHAHKPPLEHGSDRKPELAPHGQTSGHAHACTAYLPPEQEIEKGN